MMLTTLLALGITLPAADPAAARTFEFAQEATVNGLKPGTAARIWLPVPPTSVDQDVRLQGEELPAKGRRERDATYGNTILYVEAPAGEDGKVHLKMTYRITRRERKAGPDPELEAIKPGRLLEADVFVPVGGKSVEGSLLAAQEQLNLRIFLLGLLGPRHEPGFPLAAIRRQHPRDVFHLLERLALHLRVTGAFANVKRHCVLWIRRLADRQLFALTIAPHDMCMHARLAERLAVQRRSVLHTDVHVRRSFLEVQQKNFHFARATSV